MAQAPTLLDTDILSELLKQHPIVTRRATQYLTEHLHLAFSLITRYEILRGLKAKQARAQEAAFETFCQACMIVPLTEATVSVAADLYGDLYRRGALIPDADLLIAATALVEGRTLVTNNREHFARIGGLTVENWKEPPPE